MQPGLPSDIINAIESGDTITFRKLTGIPSVSYWRGICELPNAKLGDYMLAAAVCINRQQQPYPQGESLTEGAQFQSFIGLLNEIDASNNLSKEFLDCLGRNRFPMEPIPEAKQENQIQYAFKKICPVIFFALRAIFICDTQNNKDAQTDLVDMISHYFFGKHLLLESQKLMLPLAFDYSEIVANFYPPIQCGLSEYTANDLYKKIRRDALIHFERALAISFKLKNPAFQIVMVETMKKLYRLHLSETTSLKTGE